MGNSNHPQLSYEAIAPLVAEAEQNGEEIVCRFVCPVTYDEVMSRAPLRREGMISLAKDATKRSLPRAVRWGFWRGALSRFGYGFVGEFLGNIVGDVAAEVVHDKVQTLPQTFSGDEREAGIVAAFRRVQGQFVWDGGNGRWLSASTQTALATRFQQQLQNQPVRQRYDWVMLGRILLMLAEADAGTIKQEHEFLTEFLVPQMGQEMRKLALKPKVSAIELEQVDSRETVMMLAWGLALCDADLARVETEMLNDIAQGLGLGQARVNELRYMAQMHLIDLAIDGIYTEGDWDEAAERDLLKMAEALGVGHEDAQRALIKYQKRTGLI
ncbi:MAG TPA: hypothetical protein VLL52_12015 [Anaerolineae bacterium]|nr:hypothetical protein [Anaerolineae bacterium]